MIGPGSSSNSCSHGAPPNAKAAEAELISRATQTAIVAARSILMSGGSQEVALKTAKAAAESVLNPVASDNDTISGRSTLGVSTLGVAFGGRKRKAKRQAEVVASMALMSATSAHPGGSSSMGDCDNSFLNKMYGRNIIIGRHDEPSVLSGSITSRPPKIPTPKSHASISRSQKGETRDAAPTTQAQEPSNGKRQAMLSSSSPLHGLTQSIRALSPNPKKANDSQDEDTNFLPYDSGSLSQSSTMESHLQSSVETSLQGRSSSDYESDTECESDFVGGELDDKKKKTTDSEQTEKTSWNFSEALMRPVTATLNLMSCGHITSGETAGDVDALESQGQRRRPGRHRIRSSEYESRDDTFDFSDNDGNKRGSYRDRDFTSSYSESQLSCPSDITDGDSEADIKVRSSIRETMENLVTKSKLSYRKSKQNDEKRWASYEKATHVISPRTRSPRKCVTTPRNSSTSKRPPKAAPSPNKSTKSVRNGGRKATSFFKKNKGRR
eukprot:jgi/Psemu1/287852/fgenesh1_pg.216_\